jgi:hypothetical protein
MGLAVHTPPNPVLLFNGVILDQDTQDFPLSAFFKIEVFSFAGQLDVQLPSSGSSVQINDYGMATCRSGSANAFILAHDKNGTNQNQASMPEDTLRLLAQGNAEVYVVGYK